MDEQLKTKFRKLLEYQKKDIELRKLNTLINRDAALAAKNKHRNAFNDAKQTISDCDKQAGVLVSSYDELCKYIDDNEAMFGELENIGDELNEEELAERVKRLESFKSKFQNADKKIHDMDDKSKSVCRARADAIRTGNAAKAAYKEASDKHNALIESKAAEHNALKTELQQLHGELDEKMYAEYAKLVDENKFPPVVPASGDDKKGVFNCGGCGIGLPQQGNALLKDQGWCRCDNCRRIIVKLN